MAHLITGYAGKAHIKSADAGAFNAAFFGGGQYVMDFGNCFEGSIINNNTVRILDGDGLMYGRHFRIEPNTYEDMAIETGTAGTKRIDLICMTYEKDAVEETETVRLEVIKGAETSGTPTAPAYTDGNILEGASKNQMPLYKVTIDGVVLSKIDTVFELIPSYEALARRYADEFRAACDEILKGSLPAEVLTEGDVVDNLESTSTKLPVSANQARVLNEKIPKVLFGKSTAAFYDAKWMYKEVTVGTEYNGKVPVLTIIYQAQTAYANVTHVLATPVENGKFTAWFSGSGFVSAHVLAFAYSLGL